MGPISDKARSKQREVYSAIRLGLFTWPWYLVNSWNIGSWWHSWKPPKPMVMVPASGVIITTGECAQYAAAIPVTQFEIPGPFWPMTTPWRPLAREYPSAMCAAPCSCTTGINSIPAGAKMSMASMKAEPIIPKIFLTPWATSVSTKASLGVIRGIACSP